jgi:hypothetical protein
MPKTKTRNGNKTTWKPYKRPTRMVKVRKNLQRINPKRPIKAVIMNGKMTSFKNLESLEKWLSKKKKFKSSRNWSSKKKGRKK